ncbi:MAG: sigma-70 family RNA polymerase sigma factor [Acidobacteria bacterium]|nr:sigma-70 family RNA polymerase sigma factor [Acidobacteriota bacterium]
MVATGSAPAERHAAFGELISRYQDMAFACAYSVLGDFHLAEDAAQEAFITAWQRLGQLREPGAFAAWLRRVVLTQCSRMTRGKRLKLVPLDAGLGVSSADPGPHADAERRELRERVQALVRALPEGERMVVALFKGSATFCSTASATTSRRPTPSPCRRGSTRRGRSSSTSLRRGASSKRAACRTCVSP